MAHRSFKSSLIISLSLAVIPLNSPAHEYWLDPIDSSVIRGDSAIVDVRNGQNFSGSAFPYNRDKFKLISINSTDSVVQFKGRLGDYPAIHPELTTNDLYGINLETTAEKLIYEDWKRFDTFLTYHALDDIRDQHQERKLPKSDIKERYFRSAKTLIQVSDNGELILDETETIDVSTHMAFAPTDALFEMVLLDNPYSNINEFRIKLLYDNKPLPNRQAEMFWKADQLLRLTSTTDAQGIASFKMLGSGDYLLNAVQVTTPQQDDVHWISHWASITFER